MKLDKAQSTPDWLVFSFVSVDGDHAKDHAHVHNGFIHITGNDQIEAAWALQNADGQPTTAPSFS